MAYYSVQAIANEFLRRRASDAYPQQMYIQKLCHIANGWNLAINDEALISEPPQAWDNGPVFAGLWRHIRDHGYLKDSCLLGDPKTGCPMSAQLSDCEKEVVDHVWKKYRNLSGMRLSALTHERGSPWELTYLGVGRNAEIDLEGIKKHYIELALAGREASSAPQ